jgi:integrase
VTVRRADGEGTYRRLEDGTWEGRVSVTIDGKRRRPKRRARTREELAERLEEARKAATAAGKPRARRPTVEEWLRHWIFTIRAADPECSPNTLEGYVTDCEQYIWPAFGQVKLDALRADDIEALYLAMKLRHPNRRTGKPGLSAATIAHVHRTLRASLNQARRAGLITTNPAEAVTPPRKAKTQTGERAAVRRQRRALTPEESDRVMRVAMTRRNAPRWRIALSLGLRQAEALGLQVEDIDVEERVLYVWRQAGRVRWFHGCADPSACFHPRTGRLVRACDCPRRHGPSGPGSEGGIQVRWTKSGEPREYGLTPAMLDELLDHVERLKKDREAIGGSVSEGGMWHDGPGGGWLFPDPRGRHIDQRKDYEEWQEILRLAGVARRRLHSARNTAVSGLDEFGLDPGALLRTFGWSSQSMKDHYRDLMPADLRAIADAMEAKLPTSLREA